MGWAARDEESDDEGNQREGGAHLWSITLRYRAQREGAHFMSRIPYLVSCAAAVALLMGANPPAAPPCQEPPPPGQGLRFRGDGSGDYRGLGVLWQGMNLRWGYNHRINRLGSIVQVAKPGYCAQQGTDPSVCRSTLTVTAASGTGPDTAECDSYVTVVSAHNVGFASAAAELSFHGDVDAEIVVERTIEVPLDAFTAAQPKHYALLGGYDLLSLDASGKFIDYELAVTGVTVSGSTAQVGVRGMLKMGCDTPECPPPWTRTVDYSLLVSVTVVGGADSTVRVSPIRADASYSWTRDDNLDATEATSTFSAAATPQWSTQLTGITSLKLSLDDEMHMLRFAADALIPEPARRRAAGEVDTLFQQWIHGMWKADLPDSAFSFREGGQAQWTLEGSLLEIAQAQSVPMCANASITWPGNNQSAQSAEAESVERWVVKLEPGR